MNFVLIFSLFLLLRVQVRASRNIIGIDERKIANVALEYEQINDRNSGKKLTAIPSPVRARPKRSGQIWIDQFIPLCTPWDSCKHRCNKKPREIPYTCNCDKYCQFYGDCCSDYELQCHIDVGNTAKNNVFDYIASPDCEVHQELQYPIYVVRKCSSNWTESSLNYKKNLFSVDSDAFVQCLDGLSSECGKSDIEYCDKNSLRDCQNEIKNSCENQLNYTLPVLDVFNIIYANPSCAICNQRYVYKKLPISLIAKIQKVTKDKKRMLGNLRNCFPSIDKCSIPNIVLNKHSVDDLCESHGGAVVGSNAFYKNVHCAFCNGEDLNTLSCPTWLVASYNSSSFENLYKSICNFILDNKVVGITTTRYENIMPAAFSILLNFGLDGRQRMAFSSESEEELKMHRERCGKDMMWDPFSQICRKLYCSAEFVLVDYQCRKKNYDDEDDDDTIATESPTEVADNDSDFTHLSLNMEVEYWDLLRFYGKEHNLTDVMADSLAKAFQISVQRIRNLKINITFANLTSHNEKMKFIDDMEDSQSILFTIDLDLYENTLDGNETEPSVDHVVSMLASELSVNQIELDIDSMKSKILEIHRTTGLVESWCNPANGDVRQAYWNSDFTLIFEDNETDSDTVATKLYINETQKMYQKGEFVASILYQGYQMKNNEINMSRLAVVCDRKPKLDESCLRIMLSKHEYNILPNLTLVVLNQSENLVINTSVYELAENGSIFVCYVPFRNSRFKKEYYSGFDIAQAFVSLISLCISVIALALVLVTYLLFPSLRNLPGWNAMNLTFSLLLMQVTFLLGQRSVVVGLWCKIVAQLLHYEILCSFMWMNVMAYDLYKTFGKNTVLNKIRSKNKYIWRYMLYAYGTPAVIILICYLLETLRNDLEIAPHYGLNNGCWIGSKQAAIVFFAVPLAIIMIINLIFYALTIKEIKAVKHIAKLDAKQKGGKSDLKLYFRMAFVTGLTWSLSFIAAYVPCDEILGRIITYLFIVANALQGLFIFSVFVCNKRVSDLYKGLLRRLSNKQTGYHRSTSIMNWISNSITRSISTDTVVSTISSSSMSLSNMVIKGIPVEKKFGSKNSRYCLEQERSKQIEKLEKVCDKCLETKHNDQQRTV